MEFFTWKEHFSFSIPEMDHHHRKFFHMLNQVHQYNESQIYDSDFLSQIFDELFAYIKTHFREEEKLLEKEGFEGLAAHKAQHRYFEKQLRNLCQQHFKFHLTVPRSVLGFMRDWFLAHILETDRKYGDYFEEAERTRSIN